MEKPFWVWNLDSDVNCGAILVRNSSVDDVYDYFAKQGI